MIDSSSIEKALHAHVQREEEAASREDREVDSLWDHLCRTATIAERLAQAEGLDPATCRLAALFHDAGKFHRGQLHGDTSAEEQHSVEVLARLAPEHGIPPELTTEISNAILQLYRDDPDPTPLAQVLFDADNLDKLGHLGVANFFVKQGLRGRGLSSELLQQFTVELTYARHAEAAMHTFAGREWAHRRAPQTRAFFISLLNQLREDGLADLEVMELEHHGLVIDAVVPTSCTCGGRFAAQTWDEEGLKCTRIHVMYSCCDCGRESKVHFCRPRLAPSR